MVTGDSFHNSTFHKILSKLVSCKSRAGNDSGHLVTTCSLLKQVTDWFCMRSEGNVLQSDGSSKEQYNNYELSSYTVSIATAIQCMQAKSLKLFIMHG